MAVRSLEAQKAAKMAQLARLGAKGSPDYAALYAAQPAQVRKAEEQRAERQKEARIRDAIQTGIAVDAVGAAEAFGSITTAKKGDK